MVRPTVPVKNLEAEHTFYKKLGFEEAGSQNGIRLRLAGDSGQEIELQDGGAPTEVVFAVSDVKGAANELRKRGLKAQENADSVSVSDPDGVVIVFSHRSPSR